MISIRKQKVKNLIFFTGILIFIAGILINSGAVSDSVRASLALCSKSVIPSLFPFFVLSRLASSLNIAAPIEKAFRKLMPTLFSLGESSSLAIILGLLGGYPVGAITCESLLSCKAITKREAERLLAFCNNSGPAFIIGVVGVSVLNSVRAGLALFIIHALSALLCGTLFKLFSPINEAKKEKEAKLVSKTFSFALCDSIAAAISSSLSICAYIAFFSVVICLLENSRLLSFFALLGANGELTTTLLTGFFEITAAIYKGAEILSFEETFIIASVLLGWGGISVHFQALSFISNHTLRTREYFIGKAAHAALSGIMAFLFLNFKSFHFTSKHLLVLCISLIIIFLFQFFAKKGGKKQNNGVY